VHGETLRDLADQAKTDRDEVIDTATRKVGDAIDHTKKEIEETIRGVEEELDRLRQANTEKFGNIDKSVSTLSDQAAALTKVLSSAQGRGNWGERMLEDILSNSGFKRGINYDVQETLAEGGRPDYSFFLPPNRVVYLDSKFPLENYLKYCDAKEDATRKIHRDAFLKNVEQRVKELEKRDYVNQSDRLALDTVLLFIPNDGVVAFIQENKPTLIDEAASKKVVFCSPLTLYMFLSMMHQAASSFYMEQNANEVLRLLQKFSKSWTAYVKYLKDVAKHFDKIQKKLKAVTSGRVFGAVNKPIAEIEELARLRGIDAGSEGIAELNEAIAEAESANDESDDE
jgi:DNA recombination protein RmuC